MLFRCSNFTIQCTFGAYVCVCVCGTFNRCTVIYFQMPKSHHELLVYSQFYSCKSQKSMKLSYYSRNTFPSVAIDTVHFWRAFFCVASIAEIRNLIQTVRWKKYLQLFYDSIRFLRKNSEPKRSTRCDADDDSTGIFFGEMRWQNHVASSPFMLKQLIALCNYNAFILKWCIF